MRCRLRRLGTVTAAVAGYQRKLGHLIPSPPSLRASRNLRGSLRPHWQAVRSHPRIASFFRFPFPGGAQSQNKMIIVIGALFVGQLVVRGYTYLPPSRAF